jgi:HlyD family secretion protein
VAVPISAIVVKNDTTASVGKKIVSPTAEKFECVFVEKNGKADLRVVKTGIQDDKNIVIISGLQPGETVITGPYRTVTDVLKSGKAVNSKKAVQPPTE